MSRMLHIDSYLPGLTRLAADRRGVTAIVTGIALTVILGFAGLAIDVAYWLNATRGMQAAADQAAYSAAFAAKANGCASTTAVPQAIAIAAARGYAPGGTPTTSSGTTTLTNGTTTVTISCNSATSNFTVRIAQIQPMWFASLFMSTAPTASAQATAQLASKVTDLCILVLDGTNVSEGTTGSDANAASMGGNAKVDLRCGLAVDSTNISALSVQGSANVSVTDLYLAGDDQGSPAGSATLTVTNPNNLPNPVLKNQTPVEDPYAGRQIPTLSGCDHTGFSVTNSGNTTLNPGVYCGGLSLGGTGGGSGHPVKIQLNAGTYYIVGGPSPGLTINSNADVTSASGGVTFVLTGNTLGQTGIATVSINGSANVNLTAPPGGAFGGMVFFQDRNTTFASNATCGSSAQNHINGGSGQTITGAIYFPNQSVCFNGNSSTSGVSNCTQLIAGTLDFTGDGKIQLSCSGVGITPVSSLVPQLIQ